MMLDIIWAGAQHVCGVEVPKNASRRADHVRVRWFAMYAARQKGYSFLAIGRFFGMDHATVMHGVTEFEKRFAVELWREFDMLKAYLELPPNNHPIEHFVEKKKPVREKLPKERQGRTLHFVITTLDENEQIVEVDGYLQTGEYESGALGEIFLKIGKHGGHQALFDQWGISTSWALQYGAPVEELLGKFLNSRFEPSGAVRGVPGIKRCSSPLDLVSRYLLEVYKKKPSNLDDIVDDPGVGRLVREQ